MEEKIKFTEEEIKEIISSIEAAPIDGYGSMAKNRSVYTAPYRKLVALIYAKILSAIEISSTNISTVAEQLNTSIEELDEDVTKLQKDVQDLDKNKVNKSGDTMNGPLTVESQSGPGKVEVSEQGVFVTNDGENGTAYDDGTIVNQGKRIVIPLKDGTMALAENVVASVELQLFELDYKLTVRARAADTSILSENTIDLPLESMVVGGEYDEETQEIVLILQNGNQVSFPVDKLVTGLISSSEKGAPNGVASLDADGKVPKEQLPDDIGGGDVTKEYVAEEIAKVHKVYTGNSDYALRKGTLMLFVSDIASGATVYIKGENSSKMYSVESANYGCIVATNHVYNVDDDTYTLNTLTYDVPTDSAMEDFISPIGAVKTLVSTTDYATQSTAGVVRTNGNFGITMGWSNENDLIRIYPADEEDIKNKTSGFKPITPKNLNKTVKEGVTTNDETLTDEEKTSACEWLGALRKVQNLEFDGGATRGYVYFINTDGEQVVKKVQIQANADTIPFRNGSGNFYVGNPTLDYECVNKGFAEANFVAKITTTGARQLYKIDNTGGQGSINYNFATPLSNWIAGWNVGGVMRMNDPIDELDGVNKQFLLAFPDKVTLTDEEKAKWRAMVGEAKMYYHSIPVNGPILHIISTRETAFTFTELFNAVSDPSTQIHGIVSISILGGGTCVLKKDSANNAIKVFTMGDDGTWSVYWTFSSIDYDNVTIL